MQQSKIHKKLALAVSAALFSLPLFAISTASNAAEPVTPEATAYSVAHDLFSELSAENEPCSGADQGYAGLRTNANAKSFTLSWVSPIPEAVLSQIEALPSDITVNLVDAKYSWCQMQESIATIIASDLEGDISSLVPANDGSGIIMSTNHKSNETEIKGMLSKAEELPGVTASVRIGTLDEGEITAASRQEDVSPWSGGSGYGIGQMYCSIAAGVKSDANNVAYLLTSSHCAEEAGLGVDHSITTGDGLASVGHLDASNTGYYKPSSDVAVIRPWSGSSSSKMYHGGFLAASQLQLAGAKSSLIGDSVCTNGANSGKHCGLSIKSKGLTKVFLGVARTNMVHAKAADTQAAIVVQGDSGGPVFSSDVSGQYFLNGTITGFATIVACPAGFYYTGMSPYCSSEVYFEDAVAGLAAIHMHM